MEDGLIFFLHGFVLLNLGLLLTLEAGRSPALAPPRMLGWLAVFAGLRGLHDWLEIFLRQGGDDLVALASRLPWLNEVSTSLGGAALIVAGLYAFRPAGRTVYLEAAIGLVLFLAWGGLVFLDPAGAGRWGRYLLTVPGAMLVGLAFRRQAARVRQENRRAMAACLSRASTGFVLFGFFQVFFALKKFLNGPRLLDLPAVGPLPGYLLPATGLLAVAVLIFGSLFRAVVIGEQERQQNLAAAEQGFREAREQVRQELRKSEEQRRTLMRHVLIAQEDERARIARELHDETAQTITAAALNLASLENLIPKNPEVRKLVGRLQDLCHDMSRGLYRLVHDLRPAQLDDLGLIAALRHLVDEYRRHSAIEVSFRIEGQQQRLDPLVETVLFRIAQEALTNVAKHAKVAEAEMWLQFERDRAVLRVADQGAGFDGAGASPVSRSGWGVAGMNERAEAAGGKLRIESRPGRGTTVEVGVPLVEAEDTEEESAT